MRRQVSVSGALLILLLVLGPLAQVASAHSVSLNAVASGPNSDGSNIYACGTNGLVVCSTDYGSTMTYVSVPWSDDLHDIAYTYMQSNGQSKTMVAVGDGGGIWRLPLGETVWSRPTSVRDVYGNPYSAANMRALSFCPGGNGSADLGWAVGEIGTILRTTDRGENWVQQSCPVSDSLLSVDVRASNLALATTSGGDVLRWLGASWTRLTTNLPSGTVLCDVDFATRETGDWSQTAYAVDRCGAVWKTTDQGVTWALKRSAMVPAAYAGDTAGIAVGHTSSNVDTVTAVAGNVSAHTGANSTSTDGGATWTVGGGSVVTRDVVTCGVPQGSVMYAVGGVWDGSSSNYHPAVMKSLDRDTWTKVWEKTGWDREAAKDYAQTWSSNTEGEMRNPAWPAYEAECTHFVSQCPVAGGIQMDGSYGSSDWACGHLNDETWLLGDPWCVAVDFWSYWKQSPGRYLIGTYDWKPNTSRPNPPKVPSGARRGDFVSYVTDNANNNNGFDGSTWTDIDHTAIITGINAYSTWDSSWKGDLTCQHTNDRRRVLWNGQDRMVNNQYSLYGYVVWGLDDSTDSGLAP